MKSAGTVRRAKADTDRSVGALQVGDAVRVFSQSWGVWFDGEVTNFEEGDLVRVEFQAGRNICRKALSLNSNDLSFGQHVMQGNRSSLPRDLEPWEYYATPEYMLRLIECGDVALLKASWLLDCYTQRSVLPRRQELPLEATWTAAELKNAWEWGPGGYGYLLIDFVSISHCWFTRSHPDPDGLQVQQVGPFLEAKLKYGREKMHPSYDLAIFWCWCSFFQIPRSLMEQEAFERSMEHMDIWYTNSCTEVWMLTTVPKNVTNSASYDERGWTTWERTVSVLFSNHVSGRRRQPLDLGVLDAESAFDDACVAKYNNHEHGPPLEPADFDALLRTKKFTKGRVDLDRVSANNKRNFNHVLSVLQKFAFNLRSFDHLEMRRLCKLIPYCDRLEHIDLDGCPIGDEGAIEFANTLPKMHDILSVSMRKCLITDVGGHAIASALEKMSSRVSRFFCLDLEYNDISLACLSRVSKASKRAGGLLETSF